MKANDVKIGGEYNAKIGGTQMQVRIVAEKTSGGWTGINIATGKKVLITTARVLKSEVANESATTATTDGDLTVVEVPPATVETIGATAEKPARSRKAKAAKEAASETPAKSLSQLDAAVKVLGEATGHNDRRNTIEIPAKDTWIGPACGPESSRPA